MLAPEEREAAPHALRFLPAPRLGLLLLSAAYAVALTVCYVVVVSPAYAYAGFRVGSLELLTLGPALVLAIIPAVWLPLRLQRPSDLILVFLYLVSVVPVCLVPILRGVPGPLTALGYAVLVVVSHGLLRAWLAGRPFAPIWVFPLGPFTRGAVIALGAVGTAIMVVAGLGMPRSLPGLASVYETRAQLENQLASGGRGLNYALLWLSNVFAPWILAVGLLRRRFLLFMVGLGFELLVFGSSGFKSVLFTPVLIVGVWLVLRQSRLGAPVALVGGAVGGVAAGMVVDAMVGVPIVSGLITRRLVLMPGLLSGMYVEYFGTNGPAFLSHGILRGLGEPVYADPPARLVAAAYFSAYPETFANTNFWADGFANGLWPGVIVVTVLLAVVLRVYDGLWSGRDIRMGTLLLCVPCFALSNSALLTVLLTHGLGLLCMLAWMWRGSERYTDLVVASGSAR